MLAAWFLQRAAAHAGRSFTGIEPASLERLRNYHWPGNIRQLGHVIELSAVLCDDDHLTIPEGAFSDAGAGSTPEPVACVLPDHLTLDEVKKRYVLRTLTLLNGNVVRAAATLGIDRRSLYRMMERQGVEVPARCRGMRE